MADPLTQYADKVVHVTFSGKVLYGADIWQTGFYVGKAQGPADQPTQAWLDGVRDAWVTFFTEPTVNIAQSYTFDEAKAVLLGTTGKYDGNEAVVSHPATAKNGGRTSGPLPPQVTLVATTIGGSGKGLAGKSRMFLPGVSEPIDTGGHIASGVTQAIANKLAAFFNAVRAVPGGPGVPINASRGHKLSLGAGARNVPINGVRVGNVYDTQRRRRNAIAETYAISGLIGP